MTNLLKAEFLRLVSRRLTLMVLLGALLLGALVPVMGAASVRPVTEDERIEAQTLYQQHQAETARWCEEFPEHPEDCEGMRDLTVADFLRVPQNYEEYLSEITFTGVLVAAVVAVLAAALVGGDLRSGAISTQLTFTPQRGRVMAAKLVAICVGAVGITLAYLMAGTVLGTITFLMLRGGSSVTASAEVPLGMARFMLTVLLVSLLAAALTFAVGNSLLSVGIGLAVLWGSAVAVASSYSYRGDAENWLWLVPYVNLMALLTGDYQFTSWDMELDRPVQVVTFWGALAYAVVLVTVVTAIGAVAFRRRDLLR